MTQTTTQSKPIGVWECWQLDGTRGRVFIGSVPGTPDIWGDELYDWMSENIEDFDIEQYDCDGDSEHVAVMGKNKSLPDYGWEFKPAEASVTMTQRPVNTRNYL